VAFRLTVFSNLSTASAKSSSSKPSRCPSLFLRKAVNLMFKKVDPQRAPDPAVASCTSRTGFSLVMVYAMRSTVPPPASQMTKLIGG